MASRSYTDVGAVQRPDSPSGQKSHSATDVGAVQRVAGGAAASRTVTRRVNRFFRVRY